MTQKDTRLDDLVRYYLYLRKIRSDFEKSAKRLFHEMARTDGKIRDILEDKGIQSARTAHGTATVKTGISYSVVDNEKAAEYAKSEQIPLVLQRGAVNDNLRQRLKENRPWPDGLEVNTFEKIQVTKR